MPQRKALALLGAMPDTLELLLRWCPEKDAVRPLGDCGSSIRSVIERLGTLDRHHYLESVRRIAAGDGALPGLEPAGSGDGEDALAACELPELLTRFRHFRAQSVAFLEDLPGQAWEGTGTDPVLGSVTIGRVATHWVTHDAAALARLNAMCGDLTKT